MKLKGWQKVLIIIIPYFIIVGGFQFIGALLSGASLMDMDNLTSNQELIIRTFDFIGTLFLIYIFVKLIYKESLLDLGFHKTGFNKQVTIAPILVTIGIGSMFLILFTIGEISVSSIYFNFSELVKSCILFLLVAFIEETLFRGYMQHYLMQSMNKYVALVITSTIFAAVHILNPNISTIGIMSVFVCGLAMGITYIRTQSLWFPIAVHFWWNFTQVHLGFNVSGQEAYSIVKMTTAQPNILNGGTFGFEGSIFSFVSLAIILIGFF